MENSQTEFGLDVARRLVRAVDEEWLHHFERLRRDRQLSTAVRQINALLGQPEHRQVAITALKRIGLWHGGQDLTSGCAAIVFMVGL